jgi:hypothetical protein
MCEKTTQEVQEHAVGQTKVKKSCSMDVVAPRRARCTTRCRLRSPSPRQHATRRTLLEGLADVISAPVPLEYARQGPRTLEQVSTELCRWTSRLRQPRIVKRCSHRRRLLKGSGTSRLQPEESQTAALSTIYRLRWCARRGRAGCARGAIPGAHHGRDVPCHETVEDLLAAVRPLPLREQLKVQLGLAASRANTFSPLVAATVGVVASVRSRSWPRSVGSRRHRSLCAGSA